MKARELSAAIVGGLVLASPLQTYAKAPLEHMSISGGDLAEAVAITDHATLRLSNPWHGAIADWHGPEAPPPAAGVPIYEIYLEARWRTPPLNTDLPRVIYYLRYVKGAGGSPGRVYLPGRGEPWYERNTHTIYRDGHDGHWHPATPQWDALIRKALGDTLPEVPPNNEYLDSSVKR